MHIQFAAKLMDKPLNERTIRTRKDGRSKWVYGLLLSTDGENATIRTDINTSAADETLAALDEIKLKLAGV